MADQQIPPELMAQLAAQNGGAAAPPAPPMAAEDPAQVTNALLHACRVAAEHSAMAEDTREMGEAAKAALAFAQAVVVLDPNLTQSGEPLDHQVALEQARAEGQVQVERVRGEHALEIAKANAAAPTPTKSIRVKRDANGRAESYEQS